MNLLKWQVAPVNEISIIGAVSTLRVQLGLSSGGENDLRIQQELIQSFYILCY